MTPSIHPTALVDPSAELGAEVVVGPFAIVGAGVVVGDASEVGPRAILEPGTVLEAGCTVGAGSIIGGEPQDLKYQGEPTAVRIGAGTRIREYVTVNRGSVSTGRTSIGRRCFLMSYSHVAHDCTLEDDVTLANGVQLGGHVQVGRHASLGGASAVHQFARIGAYAFVGGGSHVRRDVPPFAKASGHPARLYGTNAVGLKRAGLSADVRLAIRHAFRLLFNSELTTSEAIERLRREGPAFEEITELLDFVAQSERGVLI